MELTVIIPTWKEAENVGPMTIALEEVLTPVAGEAWEVLFVDDDSPDGTADAVRELAKTHPHAKVLHRKGVRGHASACYDGMRQSQATYVAVMDCDFQHEPAAMARMLEAIKAKDLELVIGARPVGYEGIEANFPWHRRMGSKAFTLLARLGVPKGYQDPLSGLFMCKRSLFLEVEGQLSPQGFKPLTDILASAGRFIPHEEVPYAFGTRRMGESKLSWRWVLQLLVLLLEKAWQNGRRQLRTAR